LYIFCIKNIEYINKLNLGGWGRKSDLTPSYLLSGYTNVIFLNIKEMDKDTGFCPTYSGCATFFISSYFVI